MQDSSEELVHERPSPWWWLWALLGLTLVGGALRFNALDAKTLWLDEAFSLWMARHEPSDLFAWLTTIDHHPPLYYLFLHAWINWFGDGPSALRSLSALTSTLAIPFYALAARKLCGVWVAVVATLLLVISPFHIRYAQEVRMYGVLTLAVALLLFALAHLLTEEPERPRTKWWAWALLMVAEAAAMLTHNTATILVPIALNGAIGGLWLVRQWEGAAPQLPGLKRAHFYRWWLLSQIGALLLWSPWALGFVRQAQVVDGDFWIEPPTLWSVWLALGSLSYAYLPAWLTQRDYLAWLAVGLVVVGLWMWRRTRGLTWLLLSLWIIPPALELLASLRRPIFYDRTLIWTTLPFFLLLARGIVMPEVVRTWLRWSWLAITLSALCLLSGLGVVNYFDTFEKEAWDEVAGVVAEEADAHDLLLFHASWAELPFAYYYERIDGDSKPNEGVPLLDYHGIPADLFDAGALEPPMNEAAIPRVLELLEGRDRVWLVYSHWWYTDPNGLLLHLLEENFKVAKQHEWPGIQLIEYAPE